MRKHIRIKGQGRPLAFEVSGIGPRVLGVYIRLAEGAVERTREIVPEVFADFDKKGVVLGIEFTRPGEFSIDEMQQVAEKVHIPELAAVDVSRLRVNVPERLVAY